MNEVNIELAVAALVNHYVAASAGVVNESIEASYGYKKFAILFNCSGNRKHNRSTRKDKDCSDEAPSAEKRKVSEPLNAFFAFARERIEKIALEAASVSSTGNVHASTAQKLNEIWAALPVDEKDKYKMKSAKLPKKARASSLPGALHLPFSPSIFEFSASAFHGDVPLGTIGLTATVEFRRKCNLEVFLKHAACVPSISISQGSFAKKLLGNSCAGLDKGLIFKIELATHPGKFVTSNLYSTGVVKVTLVKTELSQVFDQIRDTLVAVNAAAQVSNPPAAVFDSSDGQPLVWSALKLALIKKQFDLGFRIKYSKLAALLLTLEGIIFSDIRCPGTFGLSPRMGKSSPSNLDADGTAASVDRTGSGIFARFISRNEQDGEASFYAFHTGIVQINGSRGATVISLQNCANSLFAFLSFHRHIIQPSSESEYDGSKRKRRRIAWQMGTQH